MLPRITSVSEFDVIVVGTGHAGCEAAAAAATMGAKTLLLGLNLDSMGWMPCNPAIGGPAKSHIVREIDALGGIMGLAADATYLQLKTLNSSKGAAVHSLRAQSDKYEYSDWIRQHLNSLENLYFYQAIATKILENSGHVTGIETIVGERISCSSVILTNGTFLHGKVFCGKNFFQSGRSSEPSVTGLSENLKDLGLELGRLKTGTPARLDKRSINFNVLEEHKGDSEPRFFSFLPNRPVREQVLCHATRTNERVHEIIRENISQSPLYAGMIEGVGPRYCPSIEDKVIKFPDKSSHLLFLEPESRRTNEIYLQGCSTSLPIDVQRKILKELPGLENAHMIRNAYAIEYDFLKPSQFEKTLQSKDIKGLFAAGQILGTSGYEEAAAQGLIAAINAVRCCVKKFSPFILERSESYIGTLIDDLVASKEITEPYRMMTSRSEYRIYLRQDNADRRLTPKGIEIGLVSEERKKFFESKQERLNEEFKVLRNTRISVQKLKDEFAIEVKASSLSLEDLLTRSDVNYALIEKILGRESRDSLSFEFEFEIETEIKYAGYVKRERSQIQRLSSLQSRKIPENFDYNSVKHLSREGREKLQKNKPVTIGHAMKIDGVRHADIEVLLISLALA